MQCCSFESGICFLLLETRCGQAEGILSDLRVDLVCPCIIFASGQEDTLRKTQVVLLLAALFLSNTGLAQAGLQSSDLYKLRSVSDVQFSPDGSRLAYVVENNGSTGRPYSQLWIMNVTNGKSLRVGSDLDRGGDPDRCTHARRTFRADATTVPVR